MRLFIALILPEKTEDALVEIANAARRRIRGRFVRPDSYHITLAFIGEVGATECALATGAMERACLEAGAILLRPSSYGKFGPSTDATLWVGFDGADDLRDLANAVRRELDAVDVPFDRKPFKAHVTLARRAKLDSARLPDLPYLPPQPALAVGLFESTLSPEGASYRLLESISLEKGEAILRP